MAPQDTNPPQTIFKSKLGKYIFHTMHILTYIWFYLYNHLHCESRGTKQIGLISRLVHLTVFDQKAI